MTRVVFFGNERLVSGLSKTEAPTLRGLIKQGYDVVAVVSHYTESRSRNQRPLEVATIAKQHTIPVLLPDSPADIIDELIAMKPDVAILAAYGRIIPQSIIDIFPAGIINIHPSLLPLYRGPTPIESVILNGDTQTGVSIMQITSGMDSGPVYAQSSVDLSGNETKFALCDTLAAKGAALLLDMLPTILDNTLQPTPQDESKVTYCHLFKKSDALIDPNQYTALECERMVRAYLVFPKTKFKINDTTIIATKSHVVAAPETPLSITCKGNTYLSIDELIAPSGKVMSAVAFINGHLH